MDKQQNNNPWSEDAVCSAHGYGKVKRAHLLDGLARIIEKVPEEKINLLDIGAGNGRLALSLRGEKEYDYLGLDCNRKAVEVGNNYFSSFHIGERLL